MQWSAYCEFLIFFQFSFFFFFEGEEVIVVVVVACIYWEVRVKSWQIIALRFHHSR